MKVCLIMGLLLVAHGTFAKANEPVFTLKIEYLTRNYKPITPLSLLEEPVPEDGLMGARLANQENQLTGRLMNQRFELAEHVIALDDPFVETAAQTLGEGSRFIVADLNANDLLQLADHPLFADDIILNTRSHSDELRLSECRPNLWHITPSWQMKSDGLAQYLVWKRWSRWFIVHGRSEQDLAYLKALQKAAKKFGAKVVATSEYGFEAGARRIESGHQQIQTQMPLASRGPTHDVLVVVDTQEAFGDYMLYRNEDPRPVVGTHGLSSAAWHKAYEQFGSMSLHSAFEKLAKRRITSRDYINWLAVKTIAEPAIRVRSGSTADVVGRFLADDFKAPGFKGIGLSFRRWNQQLRQPMLLAWERAFVSMSPQDEFWHQRHTLDSLGIDKPESKCRLNSGD